MHRPQPGRLRQQRSVALTVLLVVLFSAPAGAQRLPQTAQTTPAFAFELPRPEGPGLEALAVDVRAFRFEGHTVFTGALLQTLVADAIGKQLDPSALDEVRLRITRHYVAAGYINSGALLVAPSADDRAQGIVTLRIVEGRVDALRLRGQGWLWPGYLRARLLRDDEPLNIQRLEERFRLLLADPLFEKINGRIVPGDKPGSAVLDVDVQRARPYAAEAYVNNHRPPSVGSQATGVRMVVRNLSGQGDALEGTLQHTRGGNPASLAWSVSPLHPALRVFASVDRSVSTVVEESLAAIDIRSRSRGHEAGASWALVETLARRVEVGAALGRRKAETTLLGQPYSFSPGEIDGVSAVRSWRVWQDWTERRAGQALALRWTLVTGDSNVDPMAAAAAVVDPAVIPARRYRVLNLQAQHVANDGLLGGELRLRGSLQATRDRLLPLAQFAVGGNASVRGYRENTVLRDRGYVASAEYRLPLLADGPARQRWTMLAFVDAGGAANVREGWQRLSSAGLGISLQLGDVSADFSVARRLQQLPSATRGDLQDRGIHFELRQQLF